MKGTTIIIIAVIDRLYVASNDRSIQVFFYKPGSNCDEIEINRKNIVAWAFNYSSNYVLVTTDRA